MTTLTTPSDLYNFLLRRLNDRLENPYSVTINMNLDGHTVVFTSDVEMGQIADPSVVAELTSEFQLEQSLSEGFSYSVVDAFRIIKERFSPLQPNFELEMAPIRRWAEHFCNEIRAEYGNTVEFQFIVGDDFVGLCSPEEQDRRDISEETARKLKLVMGSNEADKFCPEFLESILRKNKLLALITP